MIDPSVLAEREEAQRRRASWDAEVARDAEASRSRRARRERRIAELLEVAAARIGGFRRARVEREVFPPSGPPRRTARDIPDEREFFLWFLLRHPADEWLPPADWPRPAKDDPYAEEPEELALWRGILLEHMLRSWRPRAPEAEVTEEVIVARPWQKRDGKPGSLFTAAAWVFLRLLEDAGAKKTTEMLAHVHDMAEHATVWDPPRGVARVPTRLAGRVRSRLKLGRPRPSDVKLARARLAHARRMFDWFLVGVVEREGNPAQLPSGK